jgi:holo-[acyl-carrier protein] synthase
MIAGVGVDLCGIARMEKHAADERFLRRFFSEEERAYIAGKGASAAQSLAGIFAAKEALTKALGTGIVGSLADICVLHDDHGAPYYELRGDYLRLAGERGIVRVHLSISHDGGIAAAFAVAEKE